MTTQRKIKDSKTVSRAHHRNRFEQKCLEEKLQIMTFDQRARSGKLLVEIGQLEEDIGAIGGKTKILPKGETLIA